MRPAGCLHDAFRQYHKQVSFPVTAAQELWQVASNQHVRKSTRPVAAGKVNHVKPGPS